MDDIEVLPYRASDEPAWLRCRVLAFLATAYFDDVVTTKPTYATAVELVAADGSDVAGVIDVSVDGVAATIETVAVDPAWHRRGIGAALVRHAIAMLPAEARTLDAWTRDDEQTNAWYQAMGFVETFRYLHVYASSDEEAARAVGDGVGGLTLVKGFFHARIESEQSLRSSFERVHVCRRYERVL